MGLPIFRACADLAMIARAVARGMTRSAPTRSPDGNGRASAIPDSCEAVTMPRYLIIHAERRGDDTLIEDDQLTVKFDPHWVTLFDNVGPCFAAPREKIHAVIRVDDPEHEDQKPAPDEE
ncbi:hypothetical protein GCM10009837_07710 [Streptomyces durmitorensis]|uniref:DUF397 domain-containing protein n=1 Tax=Streptomyces durmitorensis TaxID=319947 RepID=A0ABY4PMJ0_9ACTN|nr:hypothetical protein [Streptomyces durmitorensis]UQT54340.1 hypothetical protein M4V62_04155 [Streptomyces durmitorensis]